VEYEEDSMLVVIFNPMQSYPLHHPSCSEVKLKKESYSCVTLGSGSHAKRVKCCMHSNPY